MAGVTLAETVRRLVDLAQVAAENQAAILALQRRTEAELMATKAELNDALTQMETALRATVTTIGTAVSDLTSHATAAGDLTEEVSRISAAKETLVQLAEEVQAAAAKFGAP